MSYGFAQLKIIRWVCLGQRTQCMEKENRLSKDSASLIISNSVLDKGPNALVINSGDDFTSTQHNHKMGVVGTALSMGCSLWIVSISHYSYPVFFSCEWG